MKHSELAHMDKDQLSKVIGDMLKNATPEEIEKLKTVLTKANNSYTNIMKGINNERK